MKSNLFMCFKYKHIEIIKTKGIVIDDNKKSNKYVNNKRSRHYGIDLGRIIAIFFIINHHIIFHGGPLFKTPKMSTEYKTMLFLNIISISGVDIFGMISGFVGFQSHKYSNLLNILLITMFYNFGIALFLKNYWLKLRISNIKLFLYPIFLTDYWYVNAYFSMYFFLPIINKGINSIDKMEMKYFIVVLFLIYSCLGQIRHYIEIFKSRDIFRLSLGFSYSWLIIMYLYGSYFGRFGKVVETKYFLFYIGYLFFIIIIGSSKAYLIYKYNTGMIDYSAPSSVLIAVSFIKIFSNLKITNKYIIKLISFFSPLTFGIYLLHNHGLVRIHIVRNNYFSWILKYKSFKLIIMEIYCSVLIFIICSILDYIRNLLFKLFKIRQLCILIVKIINYIGSIIIFDD